MIDHVTEQPVHPSSDPTALPRERRRALPLPDTYPAAEPTSALRPAWSNRTHAAVLLAVGIVLGEHGLGILNPGALALLDPVVPVALAALGVLSAFEHAGARDLNAHTIAVVTTRSVLTAAAVTGGLLALAAVAVNATVPIDWMAAVLVGICASASSTQRGSSFNASLAIVAGGLAVFAWRQETLAIAASGTAQVLAITLTVACAGWLLLSRTETGQEQRIFGAAALLLLGGAADYLAFSALLAGLVGGWFWHATGESVRETTRRHLTQLQHPLLALILLVAGAATTVSAATLTLAIGYVLLRTAAGLGGSIITSQRGVAAADAARLVSPGILGVAVALNATRGGGPEMTLALSVVVLGTIGAQLLAGVAPREAA